MPEPDPDPAEMALAMLLAFGLFGLLAVGQILAHVGGL
jgi:hypothetical protein